MQAFLYDSLENSQYYQMALPKQKNLPRFDHQTATFGKIEFQITPTNTTVSNF
jgi:hypothetical protein